ncbi:MAG TPA: hypothetical protein DD670_11965 [Planctomycetaceae bacterium]|nr:hypothetical protein [Planctomycetaceae bacterium]
MNHFALFEMDRFVVFTLVLARVGGLTMTAPIYGTREVPFQVRCILAFALALLIAPVQWTTAAVEAGSSIRWVILIAADLLVGIFFGLGIAFLLSGVQLAGSLIGRLGGLTLADVFDPATNEQVPLLGRLMHLVALAVFVAIGGHRMVLGALSDSFQSLPPGCVASTASMAQVMQELLSESFVLAARISAPIVVVLLLSTLVLGILGRTLPQLNLLGVGFGLNSMLAFGLLAVVLGAGAMAFEAQVEPTLDRLINALQVARQT